MARSAWGGWMRRNVGLSIGLSLGILGGLAGWAVAAHGDGLLPVGSPPQGVVSTGVPVGTLGGTVSVGASGSLSWATALPVVPGPGGLQPGLSIGYGGGGYGGLGAGFSLTGLSTITRCSQTHGQDGRAEAIDWSAQDRLCLDGERLVAVSGTHGADGAEYRPRSAGTIRVVARGASTDPLSGFTVYAPDGRVSEYGVPSGGNANLASVLANLPGGGAVPLAWAIRQVRDRSGNRMEYHYAGTPSDAAWELTPQDHRIERIDYGSNLGNGGTLATRRLAFGYGTITQVLPQGTPVLQDAAVQRGYIAGMSFARTQVLRYVLQSVRSDDQAPWSPVREVGLDYEAVPALKAGEPVDQVRLKALRQCDGQANCFAPTKFEWSALAGEQSWQAWPGFAFDGTPFYPLPPKDQQDEPYRRAGLQVMGDFDADGVMDMLVSPEWGNSDQGASERWELWQVKPGAHAPVATNIPAWGQSAWVNRTGGKVLPGALVQTALGPRTGRYRDKHAAANAWPANVDGSYGTDLLVGRPQLELAGAPMDLPWGYGSQTYLGRMMPLGAPAYCTGFYALQMPGYTPAEVDKINAGLYEECEDYLQRSPADITGHPGIMAGFELWRLEPGTDATFQKQDLDYPEGRPALWAQPADLNADRLTDVVFCKADADYGAASGQPMPMYYRDQDAKINWVSGTVHYALNQGGSLSLADGGTTAVDAATGAAVACHYKDALYVMDLYGDGRESVLHRRHPSAKAGTVAAVAEVVPAGVLQDPYPYDANAASLKTYNQKLSEKVRAEQGLGQRYYAALSWRTGLGLTASQTGLPYDEFMRWQGRGGNTSGRYSRFMPSQASDVDATPGWVNSKTNRRVGWGTPEALETGFGLGEARFADVNRDGLMDVVMVDLASCQYATNQFNNQDWPIYKPRSCSFQDAMEFGRDLWEQTYEKLVVEVYANRGDGTFEPIQSQRWWDTDLYHPQYTGVQLGDALTKGAQWANAGEKAVYEAAWTIATRATRQWRTEFASSQFGDGNGDGAADAALLGMAFYPNGGWLGDTMAGTYVIQPQWRAGRMGGGLRNEPAPLMTGGMLQTVLPANADGVPPWSNDGTLWMNNGKPQEINVYEAQEYGLPVRWQLSDFDRDGVDDLMLYDHVAGTWRFMRGQANDTRAPAPQLLTAVVNGLGERTQIEYAPQHALPSGQTTWSQLDLTMPYPLVSRPSAALAVAALHRDSGGDGQGAPIYNTTTYGYGKSVSDVLRGVSLGPDARTVRQTVATSSGEVDSVRIERYDNAPQYDAALKAYPRAGSLLSETSLVRGAKDEPVHVSHTGFRYETKAGVKPGTWRRQLQASAAATYEVPGDANPKIAQGLMACLPSAFNAVEECMLGAEKAYQPLTQATRWLSYDSYGYPLNELTQSGGSTTLHERQLKHQDDLAAYALGLPTLSWVAHEPQAGAGYTVRTTAYDYYSDGRLKQTTVEPDRPEYRHSEELKYDVFGNVAERTLKSAIGGTMPTVYMYSPSGAYVTQVTNAKNQTTTSQWIGPYYEACGVAERITGAAGHSQVTDIDTFCRTTGSASYYGAQSLAPKVTTSYSEWEPGGGEGYPDVDILVTNKIAGGATSYTIADRLGRTVVSQGPGFGFQAYTRTRYDALGRAEAVSLPTKVGEQPAGWSLTRFDALGRAREVTAPDGTMTSTRIDRYRSEVTDALGHTSSSTMNALGQVVRVDPPADPDQPQAAMCYAYGAFGTLIRAEPCRPVPHKAPVVVQYDDYGRPTKVISAALGTRSTQYDPLGRIWLSTDGKGQQTQFVYDSLNRLIQRTEAYGMPGEKTATWIYDTMVPGALTQATNADGTVIERPYYDGYRRVAGLDTSIHGTLFAQRIDYDERGRVKNTTLPSLLPNPAVTVATAYNGLDQTIGQAYQGHVLWEPLEANAQGQMLRQRYGNGLEAAAEYDPLNGRLEKATVLKTVALNSPPVPIEQFEYKWYAHGLLERRTQKGLLPNVSDQSDTFYYTPRGELMSWTTLGAAGAAQSWNVGYDGYGNFTQGPAGAYSYDGERLQQVKGNADELTYTYDDNGNVKVRSYNGTKTVIDYNALNQVKGIQAGATQSTYEVTYSADGAKRHVKDTSTGRETFYLGAYQRESGGKLGGKIVERMTLGPAHLTRMWTGNQHQDKLSYLTPADHLGSLNLITDESGLIDERRSYDPWGGERDPSNWVQAKAAPPDDTHGVAAGYTGHERKRFGALIDMKARYYDPVTRRLVQADTVIPSAFNPLAWNAYAYTYNNPMAYTDPSGHAPQGGSGEGSGREFTPEQNMRAMMDFMAGMEGLGDQYAHANGLPSLGGQTGMVNGGGLAALRAIHLVRNAIKLGEAMVADHQQQMEAAPRQNNQDMKIAMLFDRDWWGFLRVGKAPPFRTVDQYKQWLSASPEARAAMVSSIGMYSISKGHVSFVAGQLGANAGAGGGNGLRNARMLNPGDSGDSAPPPSASADDAMDAAAAAGGPGGPKPRRWWQRKPSEPAVPRDGTHVTLPLAEEPGRVWHQGEEIGMVTKNGNRGQVVLYGDLSSTPNLPDLINNIAIAMHKTGTVGGINGFVMGIMFNENLAAAVQFKSQAGQLINPYASSYRGSPVNVYVEPMIVPEISSGEVYTVGVEYNLE